MTNKARLLKEIEMVKRVTEKTGYQKIAEETNRFLSEYVDALEREARHLSEDDVQKLREELVKKEKMLSPSVGNYRVACECARIRDVLSKYARRKMASGRETT